MQQISGRVDRMDQNTATYMINLRSIKWWWPVFKFVLDVSVNNAFQLYREILRNIDQDKKTGRTRI